mmetsp:Transcript_53356/g.124840  ORF Transcript_53356/g.124840 Transcript_53356/m.124840 type:complete len:550 (-) Transcript_53356:62-1711(-)
MTRDAIPWTADPGTQHHYLQMTNTAAPMGALPFGGTAHLVPVAQGTGPPISYQHQQAIAQQQQQQYQQQYQHPHMQYYQQQYQQQQPVPQQPQQPPAPATATEVAAAPCSECRGKDGTHRKGCSLAGSVLDRRRQKAAAELAAKKAQEEAEKGYEEEKEKEIEDGVEDAVTGEVSQRIPQVCNDAYNVNPVLRENILQSDYFKSLLPLASFEEVLDEIYNKVTYATPFIPNTRSPSSCFCLLMKFFQMKLTYLQLETLLGHEDSPLVPVMGLLYIRFVVDPKDMWSWYEPMINNPTEFDPGATGKMQTIGQFLRGIIEDIHYYDTILPRIPVTIQRTMSENIMKLDFRTKAIADRKSKIKIGMKIRAIYYEDHEEYEAKVVSENKDGTYHILFTEYGNEQDTNVEDMQLDDNGGGGGRSRSRSRSRDKSRGRSKREDKGGRDRSRDRSGGRDRSRSRGRDHGRDRDRDRRRSRSRDRKRDRSKSRSRGRNRDAEPIDWSKEVLKRQRDNAASKGGDYARRPTSYKSSLSCVLGTSTQRDRRDDDDRRRR